MVIGYFHIVRIAFAKPEADTPLITGILDIIHVVEYLWDAASALHDEKDPARKKSVYDRLLSILRGRVGYVIGGLKQSLG